MADEQVFSIPLNSPLEVSSEEVVVSVEAPTFMSNTQEELAGLMSNSIKYERDGYFLGWTSYDFELMLTDPPPTYAPKEVLGRLVVSPLDDEMYNVRFLEGPIFSVALGFTNTIRELNLGHVAEYTRDGKVLTFKGTTFIDTEFTLEVDTTTLKIISCSLDQNTHQLPLTRPYTFTSIRNPGENDHFRYRMYSSPTFDIDKMSKPANNNDQTFYIGGGAITIPETVGPWTISNLPLTATSCKREDDVDKALCQVTEDKVIKIGVKTAAVDWRLTKAAAVSKAKDTVPVSVQSYVAGPYSSGSIQGRVTTRITLPGSWRDIMPFTINIDGANFAHIKGKSVRSGNNVLDVNWFRGEKDARVDPPILRVKPVSISKPGGEFAYYAPDPGVMMTAGGAQYNIYSNYKGEGRDLQEIVNYIQAFPNDNPTGASYIARNTGDIYYRFAEQRDLPERLIRWSNADSDGAPTAWYYHVYDQYTGNIELTSAVRQEYLLSNLLKIERYDYSYNPERLVDTDFVPIKFKYLANVKGVIYDTAVSISFAGKLGEGMCGVSYLQDISGAIFSSDSGVWLNYNEETEDKDSRTLNDNRLFRELKETTRTNAFEVWLKSQQAMDVVSECTDFLQNKWQHKVQEVSGYSPITDALTSEVMYSVQDNTRAKRAIDDPASSRQFGYTLTANVIHGTFTDTDYTYGGWINKVVTASGTSGIAVNYEATTGYQWMDDSGPITPIIDSKIDADYDIGNVYATPIAFTAQTSSGKPYQDIQFNIVRGSEIRTVKGRVDNTQLRSSGYLSNVTVSVDPSSTWNPKVDRIAYVKASTGTSKQKQGELHIILKDDGWYEQEIRRLIIGPGSGMAQFLKVGAIVDNIADFYLDEQASIKKQLIIADEPATTADSDLFIPTFTDETAYIAPRDNVSFEFIPIGTYFDKHVEYVSRTDENVTFRFKNKEYQLHIPAGAKTVLQLTSANMREPMKPEKLIRTLDNFGRLILRSAWADSEVENYYYVNSDTIFVLRYNTVELLVNSNEPDIDQPYKWYVVTDERGNEVPRKTWLREEYPRYGMTCAVDVAPVFWRMKGDGAQIVLQWADVPNADTPDAFTALQKPDWKTVYIPVKEVLYGSKLETDAISMYEPFIDAHTLVSQCRITSTMLAPNQLCVGIWSSKGLKQWAIRIDTNAEEVTNVLTGYGFVGPTGILTGGQLPLYVCGASGFKETVRDLKTAEHGKYGVYGQSDCIYFYAQQVTGIVTHYEVTPASWTPCTTQLAFRQKDEVKDEGKTKMGFSVIAGFLPALPPDPYLGGVISIATSSTAYAWSTASTWLTRDDSGETTSFVRTAKHTQKGLLEDIYGALGLGLSGAQMVGTAAGAIQTGVRAVDPTGTGIIADTVDYAVDVLNMVIGVDSLYNTKAGPWSCKINLADCYSIGADSAVFAGPGFVQHQFVQSHWIGGGSNTEVRTMGKGLAIAIPIVIPGIQVAGSGTTATDLTSGVAGVYPVDTGLDGELRSMRIPHGRLGFRHLYLNYPSRAASSDVPQTLLRMTVENEDLTVNTPSWLSYNAGVMATVKKLVPKVDDAAFMVPQGYSVIDGCANVLNNADFVGIKRVEHPVFSDPFVYDYLVDSGTGLWYTAIDGEVVYVSVDDTKIIDGEPTNVVIENRHVLIASSYTAVEVFPEGDLDLKFLRPRPVTSAVLMWNTTGLNCLYNNEAKHAFDAYSNRIVSLRGVGGIDVERLSTVYSYVVNGPMKTSSIFPPMAVFGNFTSAPLHKYSDDTWSWPVSTILQDQITKKKIFSTYNATVENHNGYRYSIPIVHDRLALLPAAIKTIAAYKLNVVDGITSLTTELRNTNGLQRRPRALDFTIYGQIYRWNEEYISKINNAFGTSDIRDIVATLGLDYIGSTPEVAWFYSPAVRGFYNFAGSETIAKLFTAFRMYNVSNSTWDFVSQEVVMEAITNHGLMLARASDHFTGEIAPVPATVGPYDFYSMAGGMTFQGVRRHHVNRFLLLEEMVESCITNKDKWDKIKGDSITDFWESKRDYHWKFNFEEAPPEAIEGYYWDTFHVATSYLGYSDTIEAIYEWRINFALTSLGAHIWKDDYVVVYVAAETMTVGGVVQSPVTKIRLRKDMFSRRGDYGYYSFKFVSANGAGDSERLFIWSDGLLWLRSLELVARATTSERTSPLLTAPDFANQTEL